MHTAGRPGQGIPRRLGGKNGPRLAEPAPGRPVPRLPNGAVDLGGVWRNGGDDLVAGLKPGELVSLMLPWAKEVFAARHATTPGIRSSYCMPGGPLRIGGGFAWRFVPYPMPNVTHIFILQEGNAHTYRRIFMDGRPHPEDPFAGMVRAFNREMGRRRARDRRGGLSTTNSGWMRTALRTRSSCT